MKALLVLLSCFIAAIIALYFSDYNFDPVFAGRLALAAMLLFTATGHFIVPKGLSMMIPPFIPFKLVIVYITGLIEFLLAFSLLIPTYTVFSAWGIIIMLILVFPANIYAVRKEVNYEDETHDGPGMIYLWFRIPLQLLFIFWAYLSAIYTW